MDRSSSPAPTSAPARPPSGDSIAAAPSASTASTAPIPPAPTTMRPPPLPLSNPLKPHTLSMPIPMPIPPLLYGTAWKGDRTTALVIQAFGAGFRGVDTAGQRKHYREDLVGWALRVVRREMGIGRREYWVQTKFTPISGQDPAAGPIPYDPNSSIFDQVRSSFAVSLANLHPRGRRTGHGQGVKREREMQMEMETDGRALDAKGETMSVAAGKQRAKEEDGVGQGRGAASEQVRGGAQEEAEELDSEGVEDSEDEDEWEPYIDSYLLHSPLHTIPDTLEAWRAMEALVDEGKVRRIGLSNVYDPRILELLISSARIKPSILQNRWHHSTGHDVSLLSHLSPALSSGPSITYQPFWTLTGNPLLLSSPSVAQIAQRRDWTKEQVVYRFVTLGMGVPGLETALLSGTSDGKHVQQAADVPQLDPLEEMELEALGMEVYGE